MILLITTANSTVPTNTKQTVMQYCIHPFPNIW